MAEDEISVTKTQHGVNLRRNWFEKLVGLQGHREDVYVFPPLAGPGEAVRGDVLAIATLVEAATKEGLLDPDLIQYYYPSLSHLHGAILRTWPDVDPDIVAPLHRPHIQEYPRQWTRADENDAHLKRVPLGILGPSEFLDISLTGGPSSVLFVGADSDRVDFFRFVAHGVDAALRKKRKSSAIYLIADPEKHKSMYDEFSRLQTYGNSRLEKELRRYDGPLARALVALNNTKGEYDKDAHFVFLIENLESLMRTNDKTVHALITPLLRHPNPRIRIIAATEPGRALRTVVRARHLPFAWQLDGLVSKDIPPHQFGFRDQNNVLHTCWIPRVT